MPRIFFKEAPEVHEAGAEAFGGTSIFTGDPFPVGVRALNALTGELVWERANAPRTTIGMTGGVLTTTSNVLFVGDLNEFAALNAETGERLWRVNLGGNIRAAPVTYAVYGRQHVIIAAGDTFFAFRL